MVVLDVRENTRMPSDIVVCDEQGKASSSADSELGQAVTVAAQHWLKSTQLDAEVPADTPVVLQVCVFECV
jgi:hypothetical protein